MNAKQKMNLIKQLLKINPDLTAGEMANRLNIAMRYYELRRTIA